jgi:uncharacterized membrane protein
MNFNLPDITVFFLIPAAIAVMLISPREKFWPLRLMIYLAAFLLILRPYIPISRTLNRIPEIGIYIDSSLSMSTEQRIDKAVETAQKIITKLGASARCTIYEFGSTLKEIDAEDIKKLTPRDKLTDISKTIKEDIYAGRIIISDGRDNAGVNPLSLKELTRVPVFTIGIGSNKQVPDVGIADLKTPGIGFRGQKVAVQFVVTNDSGVTGKTMAYLKEGNVVTSRIEVELNGKRQVPVKMDLIPGEVGLKNYTIEIKKIPGEINGTNNRKNFQLQINRQKIRILYVAGQPSWEYSFFRRLVKSDPKVELVSFLILRNPDNVTIVPENELSLIHFPAREMFTEKIYEFDLLIYDNFSYRKFFPRSYLTHIKNFVMKGGAFIMMGGEDSFTRGGYVKTPLENILPVTMDVQKSSWKVEKFNAQLNQSLNHPVLNIADDIDNSRDIWNDMPQLEGYDPGLQPKPDSTVLLKTPDNIPVLTIGNAGQGRVMAFNTNSTWRWCMGLAGQGKTPYYYNQFWYKIIRYMIQSGDLKNVQVFPGKDKASIGESLNVNIKVMDRYWKPLNDARVKLEVISPQGKKIPVGWIYPTGEDGWYHARVPVSDQGIHKINARAYRNEKFLSEGNGSFTGIDVNKEFLNTSLNKELLTDIARISGGYYWDYESVDTSKIIKRVKKSVAENKTIKKINWHYWVFYLLLVLILTFEWYHRRKSGWL